MNFTDQVVTITVLFNPDTVLLRRQLKELTSLKKCLFIDNGSSKPTQNELKVFLSGFPNAQLVCLGQNLGIAEAQNRGVQIASEYLTSDGYILFLDQDTVPESDSIRILFDSAQSLKSQGIRLGAAGPNLVDGRSQESYGFQRFKGLFIKRFYPDADTAPVNCDQLNSSGTLIPLTAWQVTGKNREEFFIDHVETDWCFRARAQGLVLFAVPSSKMIHLMGDRVLNYWFFGKKQMPYRSPVRHYYIFRNSLALQRGSHVPLRWKYLNLIKLLFTLAYFGFSGPEHQQQRKLIWRGIKDGIQLRLGK